MAAPPLDDGGAAETDDGASSGENDALLGPAEGRAHPPEDEGGRRRTMRRRVLESGEAAMFVATFIYALQGYVAKVVERNVPAIQVVFVRSILSGTLTVLTGLHSNRVAWGAAAPRERLAMLVGKPEHARLLLLRGLCGAIAFNITYAALPYLPLADHTALFFLNPIFIALGSWPILGETVGAIDVLGVAMGFAGTLLDVRPSFIFGGETSPRFLKGVYLQLAAAVLAAGAMLCVRYIGKRESPLVIAAWFQGMSCLTSAVLLLPPWSTAMGQSPIVPSAHDAALLGLVSCTSYAAQILLNRGYQVLPPVKASGIAYLQVVWSALLGAVALGEALTFTSVMGALLICGGGFVSAVYRATRKKAADAPVPPKMQELVPTNATAAPSPAV